MIPYYVIITERLHPHYHVILPYDLKVWSILMSSWVLKLQTSTLDYMVPVDQGHYARNVSISPVTLNPLSLQQAWAPE